jgi:hypothetical protein
MLRLCRKPKLMGMRRILSCSRDNNPPARPVDGPKAELMKEKRVLVVGDEKYAAAGVGKDAGAPACSCSRAVCSLVPNTLPYPENPELGGAEKTHEVCRGWVSVLGSVGCTSGAAGFKKLFDKD